MPVPKGVNPKKYDDCVDDVKRKQGGKAEGKVNAYAVCASSLKRSEGEKCMDKDKKMDLMKKKLKKALTEKFAGRDLDETTKKEIQNELVKALTAGYDVAEPEEATKEVHNGPTLTAPEASKTTESTTTQSTTEQPKQEVKEVKFNESLFKPFSLGSTLRQQPSGNVMDNTKAPTMDYVKVQKESIRNVKISSEDLAKLTNKK